MTPAVDAVRRAGIDHRLHDYANRTRHGYGAEAAQALGLNPAQVFKTLIAAHDRQLFTACVPVTGDLNLKALAQLAGYRRLRLAEQQVAERSTGYLRGGISPLGQKRVLPTFIDDTALGFERIYVSAGRRGLEIELAPADLMRLCNAVPGALAA